MFSISIIACVFITIAFFIQSSNEATCSDSSGLWIYLDWSSCVNVKYKDLQVVAFTNNSKPNVTVSYGQVKRNATMCIEDENFDGSIYLENNQVQQNQQSINLKTNSEQVSINVHTHEYDNNGNILEAFDIFIPIRYAFLGPAQVGTEMLSSNSPDDEILSKSRSTTVEVSIRYC